MNKKAILFDLDDTLLHSVYIKWAQHQEVAKRFYGIKLDETVLRRHWGKPSTVLVKEFYKNTEAVEVMVEKFHSLNDQYAKTLIPNAISVIEDIATRGYTIGIVTNARKEGVHKDMKRLNFPLDNIHFIHTYEDTGYYKPDPAAFSKAISMLHARKIKHTTYIGDSLIDWQAAKGAHLDFIGITTGITTKKEFEDAGVTKIVKDLRELLTVLP